MADPGQPKDEELEGLYANAFQVGHNSFEFILDFGQDFGDEEPRMHTRIVTSPATARDFSELLQGSLEEQERRDKPGEPQR